MTAFSHPPARAQVVGTAAGGYIGDGELATDAALNGPIATAVAPDGSVYVSDSLNHRVRRIGTDGRIATVAGTDESGYSGDGGPATAAQLRIPAGIAFDPQGRLLIADSANRVLRRVDLVTGTIATIAGIAGPGTFNTGDGGPALGARFARPYGVSARGGEILVADSGGNTVRRIDSVGVIRRVAGTGTNGFNAFAPAPNPTTPQYVPVEVSLPATQAWLGGPRHAVTTANGDTYVADAFNFRVRKVDAASGDISTVLGRWFQLVNVGTVAAPIMFPVFPARAAIPLPTGLVVEPDGKLLVLGQNCRVDRFDPATGSLTTILTLPATGGFIGFNGDGAIGATKFLFTAGSFGRTPSGDVVITDGGNARVRRANFAAGTITTIGGGAVGDGRDAHDAALNDPSAVAVDRDGAIYVADWNNHRIRKVEPGGRISTVAGNGISEPQFTNAPPPPYRTVLGPAASTRLFRPTAIDVDSAKNLYIVDNWTARILCVRATDGMCELLMRGESPISLTLDEAAQTLYYSNGSAIRAIDLPTGAIRSVAVPFQLSLVWHMAVGPDGTLYLADGNGNKIVKRAPDGTWSTLAQGGLNIGYAWGIRPDRDGSILWCDRARSRILRLSPAGEITAIAGAGVPGNRDELPAAEAEFSSLGGLALDARGNILVTDGPRIRIIARHPADAVAVLARRAARLDPSLGSLLGTAEDALARGDSAAGYGKVAAFIEHVAAQAGKSLSAEEADRLTRTARAVQDLIDGLPHDAFRDGPADPAHDLEDAERGAADALPPGE